MAACDHAVRAKWESGGTSIWHPVAPDSTLLAFLLPFLSSCLLVFLSSCLFVLQSLPCLIAAAVNTAIWSRDYMARD